MKFTFATVLLFVATALCVGPDAMVNLHEDDPNTPYGLTHRGIVRKTTQDTTTLISFTVPDTGKICDVNFSKWAFATGSQTIALFDFVPNSGDTFNPEKACFNSKTGYRDIQRKIFVVGSPGPVYTFDCPEAGSIVNFEAVPSNGETDTEWVWWPWGWHGGFTLTAHN